MADTFRICISSPPDRDKLVAEIFFGDVQWAEINQEEDTLQIEFYPRPDGQPWRISFVDAVTALEHAKQRML